MSKRQGNVDSINPKGEYYNYELVLMALRYSSTGNNIELMIA
jgi:hypothetical protein